MLISFTFIFTFFEVYKLNRFDFIDSIVKIQEIQIRTKKSKNKKAKKQKAKKKNRNTNVFFSF